jgi:two-component system chemotaxis sensor kinase CheA
LSNLNFEQKLKTTFLEEAAQNLLDSEQSFLTLQTSSRAGEPCPIEVLDELFRLAHNFKGSSALAGFTELSKFTHQMESLLSRIRTEPKNTALVDILIEAADRLREMIDMLTVDGNATFDNAGLMMSMEVLCSLPATQSEPPIAPVISEKVPDLIPSIMEEVFGQLPKGQKAPSESVRISLDRLNDLVKRAGELMVLRSVFMGRVEFSDSLSAQMLVAELEKLSMEIHQQAMSLRMAPIGPIFQNMNRIVRETSRTLEKRIELKIEGEETELDRTVLERISDPLIHLIRNAADHGIENSEGRKLAEKSEVGTIRLSAKQDGKFAVIEVEDDGQGMDPEIILKKAIEKGIVQRDTNLSASEIYQLIFAPGFSTKTEVTDISGRGVGMDIVKSSILQLRGSIQIDTAKGRGTRFTIHLPLSLALMDGLIVRVGGEKYVVPSSCVLETMKAPAVDPRKELKGGDCAGESIVWNGETLPAYRLGELLGNFSERKNIGESIAILMKDALNRRVSLLVDAVLEEQPVVVQRVDDEIGKLPWVLGGAILGDGKPSLILNVDRVLEVAA